MSRELTVGDVLGGAWRVERLLGGGGMGSVYACRNLASGALAAVKVMHAHVARDATLRARFIAEGLALGRVRHAGVVRAFGEGAFGNAPFLLMELAEGRTLRQLASAHGGVLPLAELGPIVDGLLDALLAVHRAGVVHRDVKPDNVIITDDGAVKLVDFGIARLDDGQGVTTTGGFVGTPAFMAPEQLLGKSGQVDGRADLFSVGALIWRLLTGKSVHDDCSGTELLIAMGTRQAPSLATVAPGLPLSVVRVVDQSLAFEASRRFVDAAAMRAAWRTALSVDARGEALGAPRTVGMRARTRRGRRWLVRALLGGAALITLGSASIVLLSSKSSHRSTHDESDESEETLRKKTKPAAKTKSSKAATGEPLPTVTATAPAVPSARGICNLDSAALQAKIEKTVGKDVRLLVLHVGEHVVAVTRVTGATFDNYAAIPPSNPFEHISSEVLESIPPSATFSSTALTRLLDPTSFKRMCTDAEAKFAKKWGKPGPATDAEYAPHRHVSFGVYDHPQSETYCYDFTTLISIACD